MTIKIKMIRDHLCDPVHKGETVKPIDMVEAVYDVFVDGVNVGHAVGKDEAMMLGLAAAHIEIEYEE